MNDRRDPSRELVKNVSDRRVGERRQSVSPLYGIIEQALKELEVERLKVQGLEQENELLQTQKEQVEQQSYLDSLTGIANRKALYDTLEQLVEIAYSNKIPLALGIGDLKGLKFTNDRVSPKAGDQLIVAAAEGFKDAARGTDLVGRMGGDEFFVLLPGFEPMPNTEPSELLSDIRDRFVGAVNAGIKEVGLPDYVPTGLSFDVLILEEGESAEDFINRVARASAEVKDQEYQEHLDQGGNDRRKDDRRLQERSTEKPTT